MNVLACAMCSDGSQTALALEGLSLSFLKEMGWCARIAEAGYLTPSTRMARCSRIARQQPGCKSSPGPWKAQCSKVARPQARLSLEDASRLSSWSVRDQPSMAKPERPPCAGQERPRRRFNAQYPRTFSSKPLFLWLRHRWLLSHAPRGYADCQCFVRLRMLQTDIITYAMLQSEDTVGCVCVCSFSCSAQ